jgi:REP element-mobilizing transposase RayT
MRARPVLKRATIMVTRNVRGRRLRLKPCPRTNRIVRYVLACMEKKWNVHVIAVTVLGNHWHVVVHDPDGNLVEFQHDCHQFIARAVSDAFGDDESLWESEQTNWVRCEEPDDIINKIGYVMANPVKAGLVMYGRSWPGVRHAWPSKPRVIKKPRKFFTGSQWPDEITLEMKRPPGYDELSDDELAALIESAIQEHEDKARQKVREEGRTFLGRRRILRESRYHRPTKPREPGITPTVAARNRWRRIEALQRNRRWLEAYCAALLRWRAGDRDVVFPHGTYKMRVVHNVACAPPD